MEQKLNHDFAKFVSANYERKMQERREKIERERKRKLKIQIFVWIIWLLVTIALNVLSIYINGYIGFGSNVFIPILSVPIIAAFLYVED